MLRVAGRNFDVDAYLARASLVPVAVYRRGEPYFKTQPQGRRVKWSGCNIPVSGKAFSQFAAQLKDALRFLDRNGPAVRTLRRRAGVERATLDFGVERRPEAVVQSETFPEELVRLAGTLGLSLQLSHYPPRDKRPGPTKRKRVQAPQNKRMQLARSARARRRGPRS